MKCRLLKDHTGTHPDLIVIDKLGNPNPAATTRNVRALMDEFTSGKITHDQFRKQRLIELPKGTEIEGPNAWQLVTLGCAEPADAECTAAVPQRVLNNIEAVQEAQERVASATVTGSSFDADGGTSARKAKKAARNK